MAHQGINGYDEDIDLHPNKAALTTLHEENRQLRNENRAYRENADILESQLLQFLAENHRLKQMLASERQKNNKVQLEQNISAASVAHKEANMQRRLKELKREQDALRQVLNSSAQVLELKRKLEEAEERNKALLIENRQLNSARSHSTDADENDSFVSFKSGRFEIKKICFECAKCHQAFDSLAEMKWSKCTFHPINSAPTEISGRYYWGCCKILADGRSPPGCKEGKHVQVKRA